jgi:hypothetical protein
MLRTTVKKSLPPLLCHLNVARSFNRPHRRTMNTLQEASRVYKAFKNGGPSFGGWQVYIFSTTSLETM